MGSSSSWRIPRLILAAGALVAAVAALPLVLPAPDAQAAGDHTPRGPFLREADNDRSVHPVRGPFFGLRVNSMDIGGEVKVSACFDYKCAGLHPASTPQPYHLVRSGHVDNNVQTTDCDEVLRRAFGDRELRFRAVTRTTRWIRDVGPNGVTPVGAFIGHTSIDAVFKNDNDVTVRVPYMSFRLVGTQGLRPHRGSPDFDPDLNEDSRCHAPFHDEGYYQGGLNLRGVARLLRELKNDRAAVEILRRLRKSVIAGTFEGGIRLKAGRDDTYDFCELTEVKWWFDGVLGYACPQSRKDRANDRTPVDTAASADEVK